jgi:3-oxoadipate enol-lactonase
MEVGKMQKEKLNGVEIAYERRGRGTPLVLIHGYPLDHSIWDEVAGLLENDFDLILPDLRGFGESTTVETPYGVDVIADDIAQLLKKLGVEKAALAGHSMGGYVALAFAKKYPDQVSGLALVSSQTLADPADRKEGRYKTAAEVAEKGVGAVAGMTDKLSTDQGIRDSIRPLIERQGKNGVIGALKAMAEREDTTALLPDFKFPVVLVHGDADQLIPIDRAREVKAVRAASHLTELPGVGHLPMLDAPGQTAETLKLLK